MSQAPTAGSISLQSDSPEMAETYNATSVHQFNNGKILVDSLALEAGDNVLDVGAGTGQLGAHVAELVGPAGRVVGIEPLTARVEIARRRTTGNFEMRVGSAENLSQFADGTFDAVYLNSVFHWLNDKPGSLAEIFRVLKPGGRFAFNTTDSRRPHDIAKLVRQALAQESLTTTAAISTSNNLNTPEVLISMVAGAGFADCINKEHTMVDRHSDAESVIEWSASSQFGNFVAGLDRVDFARFRQALVKLIEARLNGDRIELERYLLFISARKPRQSRAEVVRGAV